MLDKIIVRTIIDVRTTNKQEKQNAYDLHQPELDSPRYTKPLYYPDLGRWRRSMRALGRILFVIFTFPAILHCDGWKLTISGARAFIRGDHLKTHNALAQADAACGVSPGAMG